MFFIHTLSSFKKASFILGNELWEEHFESLLDLVKGYVLDVWEERKSRLYGENACAQQLSPQSLTGDHGDIVGVKVQDCTSEVSLAKVSCLMMYTYVAPPTLVGAWSMALVLRQRIEYYYYLILGVCLLKEIPMAWSALRARSMWRNKKVDGNLRRTINHMAFSVYQKALLCSKADKSQSSASL